jgi:type VI secretion system protein ImpH
MAGENGQYRDRLKFLSLLAQEPWRFDFFSAARRLQDLREEGDGFGVSLRPSHDVARFGQAPTAAFAPREIQSTRSNGAMLQVDLFSGGLLGPHGPLPEYVTELAIDRGRNYGDVGLIAFLNIFNHRHYSHLYRAYAASRPELGLGPNARGRFRRFVGALGGLAENPAPEHFSADARLRAIGFIALQNGSIETIERTIAANFGLKATVRNFIGEWLPLPADGRARLVAGGARLSRAPAIGALGWSRTGAFEIILGPMSLSQYQDFLPGEKKAADLRAVVVSLAGLAKRWRVRLACSRGEAPPARLGGKTRLGYTSWLAPKFSIGDPADLVLGADRLKQRERSDHG